MRQLVTVVDISSPWLTFNGTLNCYANFVVSTSKNAPWCEGRGQLLNFYGIVLLGRLLESIASRPDKSGA